jgi:hypothetical protein
MVKFLAIFSVPSDLWVVYPVFPGIPPPQTPLTIWLFRQLKYFQLLFSSAFRSGTSTISLLCIDAGTSIPKKGIGTPLVSTFSSRSDPPPRNLLASSVQT